MTAWENALIYVLPFLAIGIAAKWLVRRRIDAEPGLRHGGRHRMFLLGAWRNEGSDR
ncbi:MAG TPA: hypothetical protein VMB84_20850 [Stellaceae bacterium]|nr:hypothetical protein [Stellaceae bacterium]